MWVWCQAGQQADPVSPAWGSPMGFGELNGEGCPLPQPLPLGFMAGWKNWCGRKRHPIPMPSCIQWCCQQVWERSQRGPGAVAVHPSMAIHAGNALDIHININRFHHSRETCTREWGNYYRLSSLVVLSSLFISWWQVLGHSHLQRIKRSSLGVVWHMAPVVVHHGRKLPLNKSAALQYHYYCYYYYCYYYYIFTTQSLSWGFTFRGGETLLICCLF